ncbi:NCS1 family nucleobase:cation symporter-1 [Alicyclobacillus pomorum]|uniref:NCS1 family nucleobase:cation symporter-1 n=1 Tax=Alicyclobacillus pomorum TaxID=204470 RepID=UPI000414AC0B|nr:NCS1 family nucleobase:cation symporter-1 [Alicyclobacillus pomorum]
MQDGRSKFTAEGASKFSNHDLLPIPQEKRNWNRYNFATVWMGMIHNIPTYATAGGLVAMGLSPWAAIAAIMVGSLVLYGALALNGHAGAKYGLPFPVLIRTSFGVIGANIPAVLRAFVAIMWFGIQTFAGSSALMVLLVNIWPGWAHLGGSFNLLGLSLPGLLSFLVFWLANVLFLNHGMESIRKMEIFAGPLVYVVFIGLVIWAIRAAHGLGPIYSQTGSFHNFGSAFMPFVTAVTGIIGIWATLVLNVVDFTRFAAKQREQVFGQLLGLPGTFFLFAFASITVSSGAKVAFGQVLWDPVQILAHFHNPIVILLSVVTLCMAAVSTNLAANIVSPAYDLANLFPKWIDFRRGAYLSAILSIFTLPWKLMQYSASIFAFLGTIGGLLGPVAGIMFADYFVFRKRTIAVAELYTMHGRYAYYKGFNYRAFVATLIGALVSLIGQFDPSLRALYDVSWFIGVGVAFFGYVTLMRLHPPADISVPDLVVPESKVSVDTLEI